MDYLFLSWDGIDDLDLPAGSLNPYFIGLSILIFDTWAKREELTDGLNPYFIGLSILIQYQEDVKIRWKRKSQSLFYWIIYSYRSILN